MNMYIWGIGTVNQLFENVCNSLFWSNYVFKKNEVVSGKNLSFVIGPFCTPHSICLNIGF